MRAHVSEKSRSYSQWTHSSIRASRYFLLPSWLKAVLPANQFESRGSGYHSLVSLFKDYIKKQKFDCIFTLSTWFYSGSKHTHTHTYGRKKSISLSRTATTWGYCIINNRRTVDQWQAHETCRDNFVMQWEFKVGLLKHFKRNSLNTN